MASGQYPALPDEGWGVPERKEKIIDGLSSASSKSSTHQISSPR